MRTVAFAALCGALCVAAATAAHVEIMGHPSFMTGTAKWDYVGPAAEDRLQPLLFAVRQNTANLEKEVMRVSDPVSARRALRTELAHRVAAGVACRICDDPTTPRAYLTHCSPALFAALGPLRPALEPGRHGGLRTETGHPRHRRTTP